MDNEPYKLICDVTNTFYLYLCGVCGSESHVKACNALLGYINNLKAIKLERDLLRKRIAKLEALNAQKDEDAPPPKSLGDAVDREKPLSIEEQIQRLFDLIGSKDGPLQRLQAKVENMDSRLDLNMELRKRVDETEQRLAELERRTSSDIRYGGAKSTPEITAKEFREQLREQLNPQPFDTTAFPNVGDVVECVVDGVLGWPKGVKKIVRSTDQTNMAFYCHSGGSGWFWLSTNGVYRFRRVDPASKAESEPMPPFEWSNDLAIASHERFLNDLDKRVKQLEWWSENIRSGAEKMLRESGCDKI